MNMPGNFEELNDRIELLEIQLLIDQRKLQQHALQLFQQIDLSAILSGFLIKTFVQERLKRDVFANLLGLSIGYLSKKVLIGGTKNIFKKFIGIVLESYVSIAVRESPIITSPIYNLIKKSTAFLFRNSNTTA